MRDLKKDRKRETEIEKALKKAYAPQEPPAEKRSLLRRIGPDKNSIETRLAEGFSPEIKEIILKWAWLVSMIMLVMGYLIIFFILFPDKRPF